MPSSTQKQTTPIKESQSTSQIEDDEKKPTKSRVSK